MSHIGRREFCRGLVPDNRVWLYFSEVVHNKTNGQSTREIEIDGVRQKFNYWGTQCHASTKAKPDSLSEVIDVGLPDHSESYELVGSITTQEADKINLCWWWMELK